MKIIKSIISLSLISVFAIGSAFANDSQDPTAFIAGSQEEADIILANTSLSAGVWSNWATGNNNQKSIGTAVCDEGSFVSSLEAKEQGGYGIVDMRIRCGYKPSNWTTNNKNGQYRETYTDGSIAYGMEVREQRGYGIIDGRLEYGFGQKSDWLAANGKGSSRYTACPRGTDMAGIQVKEENGHGIIDVRLYCK